MKFLLITNYVVQFKLYKIHPDYAALYSDYEILSAFYAVLPNIMTGFI